MKEMVCNSILDGDCWFQKSGKDFDLRAKKREGGFDYLVASLEPWYMQGRGHVTGCWH